MKKAVKITAISLSLLIVIILALGLFYHQELPEGQPGPKADEVAEKMMSAINKSAWDSTHYVSWSFLGKHHYLWDKQSHWVEVRWGDHRVLLHSKTSSGTVFIAGQEVYGKTASNCLAKAKRLFYNDSFWLNPVVKAFDEGTHRSLVTLQDGSSGLKITYTSGGVTPGDSYLWILDENYRPVAWKMWVQLLPIGGVKTTWENWVQTAPGFYISTRHNTLGLDLEMITDLKAGQTLEEIDRKNNPFLDLVSK